MVFLFIMLPDILALCKLLVVINVCELFNHQDLPGNMKWDCFLHDSCRTRSHGDPPVVNGDGC